MRGLLLRLSKLDEGAESAVRIISYFDGLTRNHASAEVLVRAAANLAECSAGLRDANGSVIAFSESGESGSAMPASPSAERPFGSGMLGGVVWLERSGEAGPLDDMVLERMAVAAEIVIERRAGLGTAKPEDSVLIRTLINPRARAVDRLEAGKILELASDVWMVALFSDRDVARDRDLQARLGRAIRTHVRVASISENLCAFVFSSAEGPSGLDSALSRELVGDERVGLAGPVHVGDGPMAWTRARNALRFARSGNKRVVSHSDLGVLEVLAEVDPARTRSLGDVVILGAIAEGVGGVDTMKTLRAITSSGSVRKASTELHLHHSSVTARLRKAEAALGFSLDDLDGLFRLRLALTLRDLQSRDGASGEA